MNPITGTTGPAYTDQEKDFLVAGAKRGKTAAQIAAMFEKFANKRPGDFNVRSIESLQVKASQLGLSLAQRRKVELPKTRHIGVRPTPVEAPVWAKWIDDIANAHGFETMKEVVEIALKHEAERVVGQ